MCVHICTCRYHDMCVEVRIYLVWLSPCVQFNDQTQVIRLIRRLPSGLAGLALVVCVYCRGNWSKSRWGNLLVLCVTLKRNKITKKNTSKQTLSLMNCSRAWLLFWYIFFFQSRRFLFSRQNLLSYGNKRTTVHPRKQCQHWWTKHHWALHT